MLAHIAEWAGAAVAAGVIAGLVLLAAGAAAAWWLYRRLRRRVQTFTGTAARYTLQAAAGAAAAGRGRAPARVTPDLPQRTGRQPGVR